MSRSTSPETSPFLSRRAVLPSIAAAPTALAAVTGQAFSSPLAAGVAGDPRFAQADRLMAKIVDAEARWCGVSESKNPRLWKKLNEKWYDARQALEEFETEIVNNPHDPALDAVLFARIANFWMSADGEDGCDELEYYPSFRRAVECSLRAAALEVAPPRPQRPPRRSEPDSSSPAPTVPTPLPVNAGNAIAQIRRTGAAYRASLAHEAGCADDTPAMAKAMAVSDRRLDELKTIRNEIFRKRPLAEHSPYDWCQRDDFIVWMELIAAFDQEFWKESAGIHPDCAPVLRKMVERAKECGDDLVEHAQWWTSKNGCANVG